MSKIDSMKHKIKSNYKVITLGVAITVALVTGFAFFTGDKIKTHEIPDKEFYDMSYKDYRGDRFVNSLYDEEDSWELQSKKNHQWNNQIYEIDRYRNESLRNVYLENAWTLYNRTYNAVEKKDWFNKTKAKNDGFYWPKYTGNHNINDEFWYDNKTLDPDRPEFLMYGRKKNGPDKLWGVMYMLNTVEKEGQQIAGPLAKWHYHTYSDKSCFYNGFPVGDRDLEDCPEKYKSYSSPEMVHVWFIDHPEGVFATEMSVGRQAAKSSNDKMTKSEFYEKVKEDDYDQ